MREKIGPIGPGLIRDETGSALILVLVLLVLGSLVILPALASVGGVLKTGARYEEKTAALYAADAGIEDGICQIKNDQLPFVLAGQGYHKYDYDTAWSYNLKSPVNGLTTTVTIQNFWVPKRSETENFTPSDPAEVAAAVKNSKLMVSGAADESSGYDINISFEPETGDNLTIKSIGIWLPYGFDYVTGSGDLEKLDMLDPCRAAPDVFEHAGGWGVVWEFPLEPNIIAFPDYVYNGGVQTIKIGFDYTANVSGKPAAIAWVETDDYLVIEDILPVTWDVDTSIYRIISEAGGTEIEAYVARCELRDIDEDIAGDYKATGNSLMLDKPYTGPANCRDLLLDESSATISTIPPHAIAVEAYLYWGAWFNETKVLDDDCDDFDDLDWGHGAGWSDTGRYRGHSTTSNGDPARFLTSKTLDLSGLDPSAVVEVRWEQSDESTLEPDDILQYQFYDGTAWSENFTAFADDIGDTQLRFTRIIPQAYLTSQFKLRFNFLGFTDVDWWGNPEYCRLDNIGVTWYVPEADQSVKFVINGHQVYFDENGDPAEDLLKERELTASDAQWKSINNRRGFTYACKVNVTDLVLAFSDNGSLENPVGNGNGTYTVGSVDGHLNDQLAWGGWSIVVVYASPETAGHRIYLFDRTAFNQGYQNTDFDYDGEPGGDISGFIVPEKIPDDPDPYAGHMTCFVGEGDNNITGDKALFTGQSENEMYLYNSVSPWDNVWNMTSPGMTFDGVDVDTFDIPWDYGGEPLVEPGNTTAHLDLRSDGSDAWNLIYLILSLRSETTTGGTTHYVIHND